MKKYFSIFWMGMLISFIGSLPPGLMNILAIQVSEREGVRAALWYAAGSMLAEVIVVRMALSGMNWFTSRQRFFSILEWMTAGLLLLFAISCFIAAGSMQDFRNSIPVILLPPFLTGILTSFINPLHIPFWLGWSTVLVNKGTLQLRTGHYNGFVTGIGAGTVIGFLLYIYGGKYLFALLSTNSLVINCAAGSILLTVAFFHVRKMIKTPLQARYAQIVAKK